ncbi:hypothetical protein V5O48_018508, partial [Marasmius crinis-equi]
MIVQNTNTGLEGQNNYNVPGQNFKYGGDQIVGVNIGRDLVQNATTTISNPHKSLWDAIAGVGASHRAKQQYSCGECLEGTRIEVLRIIHDWRTSDSDVPPICWLSGPAGVGKTAIAMTVVKSCEEDRLIESFFFFRFDPKRNNPSALTLAIAHGLGVTIPRLESVTDDRITADPKILEATLELQFRELVLKPSLSRIQTATEPVTKPVTEPVGLCIIRRLYSITTSTTVTTTETEKKRALWEDLGFCIGIPVLGMVL